MYRAEWSGSVGTSAGSVVSSTGTVTEIVGTASGVAADTVTAGSEVSGSAPQALSTSAQSRMGRIIFFTDHHLCLQYSNKQMRFQDTYSLFTITYKNRQPSCEDWRFLVAVSN
jgi:hypothetical protein